MASRLCHFISVLAILISATSGTTRWGNIRAATALGNNVILFTEHGQMVDTASNQTHDQSILGVRSDFVITAASCHASFLGLFCMFFGDMEIYFRNRAVTYENRDTLDDGDFVPDFLWHGIDALVAKNPGILCFKGCEYIQMDARGNWQLTPRRVSELDVPCHVDAGWFDGTNRVVLKGNQVWYVGRDINQPVDFDDYLREIYGTSN